MSTMPFTQRWVLRQNAVVQFVDAILRGIAQVMFLNNSISGIFICIGMLVSSRYYTLCMLLGVVSSSLTGSLFGLNGSSYANGLYGYNGTLVGVGIAVFSFGDDNAWVEMP
jgi:urea transporter